MYNFNGTINFASEKVLKFYDLLESSTGNDIAVSSFSSTDYNCCNQGKDSITPTEPTVDHAPQHNNTTSDITECNNFFKSDGAYSFAIDFNLIHLHFLCSLGKFSLTPSESAVVADSCTLLQEIHRNPGIFKMFEKLVHHLWHTVSYIFVSFSGDYLKPASVIDKDANHAIVTAVNDLRQDASSTL